MLRAATFENFKQSKILLILGDNLGIKKFQTDLINLKSEIFSILKIESHSNGSPISVRMAQGNYISLVEKTKNGIIVSLSPDALSNFIELIDPLIEATTGHQYLEVSGGLVDEIMISVNEYPENI